VRPLDDQAASATMFAENMHRADLDPIEEAKAYRSRMKRFGLDAAGIAEWANVPARRVLARLALLSLRDDVQHLVSVGQMPLAHAACMTGLDRNRQAFALRHLTEASRPPTVAEFRLVCGKLRAEQAQESLFDDALMQNPLPPAPGKVRPSAAFHTDPNLPPMRPGRKIGDVMLDYINDLKRSSNPHHQAAALVVGSVFSGLLGNGLCYPSASVTAKRSKRAREL
jgi:hypothetical protein